MQFWALSFLGLILPLKLEHTPFELFACLVHGLRMSLLPYKAVIRTGEFVQASSEKVGEAVRNRINQCKGTDPDVTLNTFLWSPLRLPPKKACLDLCPGLIV